VRRFSLHQIFCGACLCLSVVSNSALGIETSANVVVDTETQSPVSRARPNIVFILADDLGYTDIASYGSEVNTPTLTALAEQGVSFTNYHTAANCAPARAMLLTGVDSHVGSMEDITKTFDYIRSQHGRLDILVNNAAANPYFGHVLDTDLAAYEKTVDVNVRGYFFMSIEGGKLMRENGGGAIVNTASVNALQPGDRQGIYSITKAAVVNMTKTFAKECAPFGIRCNALLPGFTKTKFAGALFTDDGIYQQAVKNIAMGRHAEPEEMTGTVLYLVSDASSYTTGECIVVDGGLTI